MEIIKKSIYAILVLSLFTTCKEEEEQSEETPSNQLYFKFKFDSVLKNYESNYGLWGATLGGNDPDIYATVDEFTGGSLEFNFKGVSEITGDDMLALKGEKIYFDDNNSIYAQMVIDEIGGTFSASYLADNSSSVYFIKVDDVKEETSIINPSNEKLFRITGTFQCRMGESGGTIHNITEGSFSLIYIELI